MRAWESNKLSTTQMLQIGVRAGVTEAIRKDIGEVAGEEVYGLGADHQLISTQMDVHSEVVHLACIADVVTTALRKGGPWRPSEPVEIGKGHTWTSDVYLDTSGTHLRRVIFVSAWDENRHYSVLRSWASLANVCIHGLPLQIAVVILGAHRSGKYYGYWSKAVMHPANKTIRFRKRNDISSRFKDTWIQCWREDHDQISSQAWLQSMLDDGVLQDSLLLVDLPVPEKSARDHVIDLAVQKLDKMAETKVLPIQNLSTCDFPRPCIFRSNCHGGAEPSGRYGFVRVESL